MPDRLSQFLDRNDELIPQILEILALAGAAMLLAWLLHWLVFRGLHRLARSSDSASDDIVLRKLARPTRYALMALAIVLVARELPVLAAVWEKVAGFVMPALVGWVVIAVLHAFVETMALKADITVEDNLHARRKRTKLSMFRRIATFVVVFVTVGLMLLSIPGVRDVGLTLVASAGLAGLAVGAAAQPALRSLIAGVQVAATEPINIDDVVIVEGEWGWIEEIRTTHVVVKIWDERRLIVPTTKFLEEPFQNWTKTTAQLLGTVFLYLDPTAKVGPIREEFERQVKANRRWDGRVQVVQVTETTRDAKEVRLLMSAKDSPTLFDLRCDIREGITDWITDNCPEAWARTRVLAEMPGDAKAEGLLAQP
ncbi:mechanosensitive ion channel family protein [Aurantiacibacter sp. MUD11]|uniref:mechanosensitive ion channel family protein n=1 Tax=Aurantiacibacter sp. MUD11 TaxID=3003265 RepID=UPI0022AA2B15|nr:mechanosensitive ion channel family protein [Aurantiacibacter sp. MUD11]WAT17900.1 mechanosensitive ion channel family protein [Aurantiacibacter sp. MUD11]